MDGRISSRYVLHNLILSYLSHEGSSEDQTAVVVDDVQQVLLGLEGSGDETEVPVRVPLGPWRAGITPQSSRTAQAGPSGRGGPHQLPQAAGPCGVLVIEK